MNSLFLIPIFQLDQETVLIFCLIHQNIVEHQDYVIKVKTADRFLAGTSSKIFIYLYGYNGQSGRKYFMKLTLIWLEFHGSNSDHKWNRMNRFKCWLSIICLYYFRAYTGRCYDFFKRNHSLIHRLTSILIALGVMCSKYMSQLKVAHLHIHFI